MSGRATFEEIARMLQWRDRTTGERLDDAQLVESLSVEGLPYDQIPAEHYEAVKTFRTNQARRLGFVQRYRTDHGAPVNCMREGCLHEPADSACIPDPEVE